MSITLVTLPSVDVYHREVEMELTLAPTEGSFYIHPKSNFTTSRSLPAVLFVV